MLEHLPHFWNANITPCVSPYLNIVTPAFPALIRTQVRYCDYLSTTDGDILLHAILAALPYVKALPPADKIAKVCADEYTDDNVSVVVHGEQHDKVCYRKLQHMEQGADSLLEDAWPEVLYGGSRTYSGRRRFAVVR